MPLNHTDSNVSGELDTSIYHLVARLFPICRSITGNGVRKTLAVIKEYIPVEIHEVPSGTQVFDWKVPREWNIRDAYIKDSSGKRILDFRENNLHVVSYSVPVHRKLPLHELKTHLHTLPEHPDWVPYRTSYYNEDWGFCLSQNQLSSMRDGEYEVMIDASLEDGHLSYGEFVLPGETEEEILLTTHICHPSLANDNLSGIAVLTHLARYLQRVQRRHTYRFLFIPGTIGSITWLALNEQKRSGIKCGLVVACVGDGGGPTYKCSRHGDAPVDLAARHVLQHCGGKPRVLDFSPYGYDERQFCSPGINLPVGLFERSKYGEFPEYHTSADNLDFVTPGHLLESFHMIRQILEILERNRRYVNRYPMCEPQLGKRGLYDAIGGDKDRARRQMALLWVLNQSDGSHSLLDIAERADLPFEMIDHAASLLEDKGLVELCPDSMPD